LVLEDGVRIPMFPLSTVLFPSVELPIHVFEPRYRALMDDVLQGSREFGTVLIAAGSEVGGGEKRTNVGTLMRIEMAVPFEDGRWMMVARGVERIKVRDWLDDDPYPMATVDLAPSDPFSTGTALLDQAAAAVRRVRMLLSELDEGPCSPIDLDLGEDPLMAAWMICALAPLGLFDAQRLLECSIPEERLAKLIGFCCEQIRDVELLLSQQSQEG
jgi:Lon protease-like protein